MSHILRNGPCRVCNGPFRVGQMCESSKKWVKVGKSEYVAMIYDVLHYSAGKKLLLLE